MFTYQVHRMLVIAFPLILRVSIFGAEVTFNKNNTFSWQLNLLARFSPSDHEKKKQVRNLYLREWTVPALKPFTVEIVQKQQRGALAINRG